MGNKPMFLFAGVYENAADAEADYSAIKDLHSAGIIGSYDSAIIEKQRDGEVEVTKTEKPTQHGGWIGLAAGAAVTVAAPVAMPALGGGRRRGPRRMDWPRRTRSQPTR